MVVEVFEQKHENHEHKNEGKMETLVTEVKSKLTHRGVSVPSHYDKFIERCIRVKSYDPENATELLINFGKMWRMHAIQDLHALMKPSEIQGLYWRGVLCPLRKRDALGRQIIFLRAEPWNPTEFCFDKGLASLILLHNYVAARSKEIQNAGTVIIIDCSHWTLQQVKALKLNRLTIMIKLMQNCTPGKLKGFHLIYHPSVVNLMFLLVKPFMKAKLAKRVHFHANEDSLNQVFGSNFLSETVAGIKAQDDNVVDNQILMDLIQTDDYCQEMVKSGYPSY